MGRFFIAIVKFQDQGIVIYRTAFFSLGVASCGCRCLNMLFQRVWDRSILKWIDCQPAEMVAGFTDCHVRYYRHVWKMATGWSYGHLSGHALQAFRDLYEAATLTEQTRF